jgi:purine-binding chemotaxis protein CheW
VNTEGIDWNEVRKGVDDFGRAVEPGMSPEEERRILRERARELAGGAQEMPLTKALLEIVEFTLGGERYAIELRGVREVCALQELTPVPCAPAFVLGIINLRGEIRVVISLKEFFGLPCNDLTDLNRIILIGDDRTEVGLIADAGGGVRGIDPDDLQASLPTLTGRRVDYLRGVTADGLVVLDAAKILSDPRLVVNHEGAS